MKSFKTIEKGSNHIIYFNDDFFHGNLKEVIFENDFYLISKNTLRNFTKSFPKFSLNFTSDEEKKESFPHCVIFRQYPKFINQQERRITRRGLKVNLDSQIFEPYALKADLNSQNSKIDDLPKIEDINRHAKNFQKEGARWLMEGKSKIFADDMGLGKTMQSLLAASSMMRSGEIGTCLIVCPITLINNWESEIVKWLPNFTFQTLTSFSKKEERERAWRTSFGSTHFIITNYEHLREPPISIKEKGLDLIIADEAHKLRKKTSIINKSISKLKYKKFWALSGTPIERDLDDVINIMKLVDPTINALVLKNSSKSIIKQRLKKYFLRRLKDDVLDDLKEFETQDHLIELSKKQEMKYKKLLANRSNEQNETLKLFSSLKEICDLDINSKESSKIDFAVDLIQKIVERNEKGIVFSFWIEPLKVLENRLIKENIKALLFIGEHQSEERTEIINKFKEEKDSIILLCSGKIASEGLNLTEANHAIFLNLWWNPSINNQARDRILRIGQNKKSFIHKIFTKNTIEDSLRGILSSKKELTNDVIEKLVNTEYEIWDK